MPPTGVLIAVRAEIGLCLLERGLRLRDLGPGAIPLRLQHGDLLSAATRSPESSYAARFCCSSAAACCARCSVPAPLVSSPDSARSPACEKSSAARAEVTSIFA